MKVSKRKARFMGETSTYYIAQERGKKRGFGATRKDAITQYRALNNDFASDERRRNKK